MSFGESSGSPAVIREHEPDLGVARVDAVLARRRCRRRGHEVADGRVVGERHEAVPEALGDVDRAAVDVVEQDRVPLAEGRRSDPDVDDEVEDRAVGGGHVLGLARRDVGEVDAADDAALRDRGVALREVEAVSDRLLEAVEAVPLEEDSAVVAELLRGDLVAVGDLQFTDLHGTTAYRASRSDAVVGPVSRPRAPSRPT